ncbi:MAG: carboxylesterase family protein, partial [Ilumatobacteraceae bacterium]
MAESTVVRTASGAVAGTTVASPCGEVDRFAGIPYGTAPVGNGRFRAATAVPAWSGVRSAASFGPSPMQATGGPFAAAVPGMTVTDVSEDCLTLNIWRPAGASTMPLPVMVWVYGGAFIVGGSAAATYDGARLAAEQQLIVISVNYRVGAFGFLDLRTVPGGESTDTNCGLHDLALALRWVQSHIAGFGGDPTRVTLFGESAGAGSIVHLLTVPGIDGLVRGAIAQSPGIDFTQTTSQSEAVTEALLAEVGASTVAELRRVTAARLVEAQEAVAAKLLFDVGTMIFHPVVDETFVTASPSRAIAAGAADAVALLIGYTADEMRLFPDPRADELDDDALAVWVRDYLAARMARDPGAGVAVDLVRSYPASMSGSRRWAAIQTDGIIRQPVIRLADSRGARSATFVYQFDWPSRRTGADRGAFHAIELPFVFDAFDTFDPGGWGTFLGVDDGGLALGRALRAAWAAFAATADPSNDVLGPWPRFEPTTRSTMVLDEH